ncbi:cobalamin-binding protein [Enemella dayhoffiae]|uniref:Cobalamin-binding protein n=1 Tax=Enemella dayhoffiae TaxID=2016507 RepID=A0A255GYV8_9ACTN|nr:helical backbone metal receptor [Enemella dayhoffiae]OYO20759.1 cobalamin-binding protein [Enemella dayhoffiae]
MPIDDLGHPVPLPQPPQRICSLVPSLTEALAATTPERLVGATDWCTHPADLDVRGVRRVRGTKNPNLDSIRALRPDLVVANQEENRELDVQRLRDSGIAVWVTRIESLADAFHSIGRLCTEGLGVGIPDWLRAAEQAWAAPSPDRGTAVVPIWKNPWMVVGEATFTADLLTRLGVRLLVPGPGRYPAAELSDLHALRPDRVLLPDEPYAFGPADGPEDFPQPTVCLSGRALTWYGPSLITARAELEQRLDASHS